MARKHVQCIYNTHNRTELAETFKMSIMMGGVRGPDVEIRRDLHFPIVTWWWWLKVMWIWFAVCMWSNTHSAMKIWEQSHRICKGIGIGLRLHHQSITFTPDTFITPHVMHVDPPWLYSFFSAQRTLHDPDDMDHDKCPYQIQLVESFKISIMTGGPNGRAVELWTILYLRSSDGECDRGGYRYGLWSECGSTLTPPWWSMVITGIRLGYRIVNTVASSWFRFIFKSQDFRSKILF